MDRLGLSLADVLTVEPYADGWRPVAERIAARHGLGPENVVTTHACSMANHLVFAAFVEPGDDVLLESPVYEPLAKLVAYFGARAVALPRREENGWRLDPGDVRRALTTKTSLVVLSNLHNPTGAHEDDTALAEIAQAAANAGAHVLVDEVYLEFLCAAGVRSAARLAPNVVATSSMTKVYGLDALRFGWVLAEAAVAERIRRLNDLFSGDTAHPSARIAFHALASADALLDNANALLMPNIDIVDQFVRGNERLSWVKPRAGTCGLVRVAGIDRETLSETLHRDHGVAIVPGRFFDAPHHVRLAWSIETSDLREALTRIGAALAALS